MTYKICYKSVLLVYTPIKRFLYFVFLSLFKKIHNIKYFITNISAISNSFRLKSLSFLSFGLLLNRLSKFSKKFKLKKHIYKLYRRFTSLKRKLNKNIKKRRRFVAKKYKSLNRAVFKLLKPRKSRAKRARSKKIRFSFVVKHALIQSALISMLVVVFIFYYSIYYTLPSIDHINLIKPKQTSFIYDKNGALLMKTYKDENRTLVSLDTIPTSLKNAIIAIEDGEFKQHSGISLTGIIRAAHANYTSNELSQGGSTITQQLVKNLLLDSEKSYTRKVKEAILALKLETYLSKDKILELYLNTVGFGGTTYGVQQAAQVYFAKDVKDLNLAESSMIAGLPVAPSIYSPYVSFEAAKDRQADVLTQMVAQNFITMDEAIVAYNMELNIQNLENKILYPHFVYYVTEYLSKKYGDFALNHGGLQVYTSLDPEIQNTTQQIVTDEINNIERLKISNGAALVTNNKTGEIIAMVGSRDYNSDKIDGFVNLTTALRQPGSSIKPFNYSLALKNGMTAASIIKDTKVSYKIPGSKPYVPVNYDGKFRGNVTLRRALSNSLNIPSVRVLEKNGVKNFVEYVKQFGISTWNNDYYGLSLALGAAEVRMTEMNNAYSVFANDGKFIQITPIKYILDSKGDVLEYNPCLEDTSFLEGRKFLGKEEICEYPIIPQENAFIIKNILADNKSRSEAFGSNSVLNIPGTSVKTGTTNDLRDNWTFGFNKAYTVGAWVGNNDNSSMSYVASGITGASPIWAKVIKTLMTEENKISFDNLPVGIVKESICPLTQTLSCGSCKGYSEYFIKGTEPKNSCSKDQVKKAEEKKEETKQ